MVFPYRIVKAINDRTYQIYEKTLPWIKVVIFNPNKPRKTLSGLCLADTGADLTFFDTEIGEYLGYVTKEGRLIELTGIGGGVQRAYFFEKVGIRLEDPAEKEKSIEFIDRMGFSKNNFPLSSPQQTGILGTVGFFRNVNVYFSYPEEIKITENTNIN